MIARRNGCVRGYSLLELIVSLGLFSMVMLIVTGAYLTLISLDRQARAGNQLAASLSFAMDSMARGIRTGQEYACNANTSSRNCTTGSSCTAGGGNCFSYVDSESGETVIYRLKTDGSIGQCTGGSCSDGTAVSLTDPRIDIEQLRFYVRGVGASGASGDALLQPYVTIVVKGSLETDAGESTGFTIQTGATQRLIEI